MPRPTVDKLTPRDPRVSHCNVNLRGHNYHYLHAVPQHRKLATVVLVHGWPDLSFGWRYQVPLLLNLGMEVVALDMMGYGGTDAPHAFPDSDELALYGMKRASDDIAELAKHLGASTIILGGHDWGGYVVYRVALHHPELVAAIFSVCTPYTPPQKTFLDLDQVVARAPQFGYQKHLAGPAVEAAIKGQDQLRRFLNGMYGARTPARESSFDTAAGINFAALPAMGKSSLLSDQEMAYYCDQYDRNGMHGPLNWYRTRKVNYEDELGLSSAMINVPVLYIAAEKDNVLLPSMSSGMEKFIPDLTRGSVPAGHWALWQTPEQTNACIQDWFTRKIIPVVNNNSKL